MNHLAHFLLAGDNEGLRVGALLGDYLKGPLRQNLPREIEHGVRLHRRIDAFTDDHPRNRTARSRFAEQRRLAGIVLDMYYDHFLSLHWERFHDQPLTLFSAGVLDTLETHRAFLSADALKFSQRLREYGILERYHDIGFIHEALRRIGLRLRREAAMESAIEVAATQHQRLEQDFLGFFPELVAFSACERVLPDVQGSPADQQTI